MNGTEFLRWYWLKAELTEFAGALGIRRAGSKDTLSARIAAALDGVPFDEPEANPVGRMPELTGPLTASTLIPRGQRCSQVVRAWFQHQVGTTFRFDAHMRDFFAMSDGSQTMHDALAHYRATRNRPPRDIGAQFEYNRFTRAWHDENPAGSREDLLRAWRRYRSRPTDQR